MLASQCRKFGSCAARHCTAPLLRKRHLHRMTSTARAGTEERDTESPPQDDRAESAGGQSSQGASGARSWGQLAADVAVNPLTYLVAIALCVLFVNRFGDADSALLVLAALPVAGLTALSKSSVGKQVQEDLERRLPELDREAHKMQRAWQQAKARSPHFGAARLRLPGPLGGASHLPGELPGDQGFDPLALWTRADAKQKLWFQEAELLHARWAMLGIVGCLVPEVLSMQGAALGEPVWWKVGAAKLNGELSINYAGIQGFKIAGNKGVWLIAACQLPLMAGPEYARYVGINSLQPVGVYLPGDQVYPGGAPFDPLGLSNKPDTFLDQQVKEIKNGRLAMIAMLGLFVQAAVTRRSPVQNMTDAAL